MSGKQESEVIARHYIVEIEPRESPVEIHNGEFVFVLILSFLCESKVAVPIPLTLDRKGLSNEEILNFVNNEHAYQLEKEGFPYQVGQEVEIHRNGSISIVKNEKKGGMRKDR